MPRVSVVGVPSSAGSYAAGQDRAPAALRAAGLIDALVGAGLEVNDDGDLPTQIWKPDRAHPYAQNVEQVSTCLRDLTNRLSPLLAAGDTVLVVGGNCTVALSIMAALQLLTDAVPGLLYVDRHFDMNTPESITDGALDWMGMAHGLSLPGCVDELADAFERRPLLQPNQVAWLGVDRAVATEWEREQVDRLGVHVGSNAALCEDPAAATASALNVLPAGPLAVHVDVDVLDFTDAPLAENTDGRNSGPSLDQLSDVLALAVRDPRFRTLSIGELNPTRAAGEPESIARFVRVLATTLGAKAVPAT
jgi:arginase